MRLPPVNPYIATDFSLKTTEAQKEEAVLACTALASSLHLPVVLATPPELLVEKLGTRGLSGRGGSAVYLDGWLWAG